MTADTIGKTGFWTNKVEIADLDGDGRPDLIFANGGDYSTPGAPEPNQVFLQSGEGFRFAERTRDVLGPTPDLARVVKARDLNGDGQTDIVVGTTYQTQSRLYLGEGRGRFREVTATHLPRQPLSVGDLEPGDVDGDGDLDLVLADWGPGNNMSNDGGRTRLWLNDGAARFTDATDLQDARHPRALLVGPRACRRGQRRRSRPADLLQALRRQLPVPQRRRRDGSKTIRAACRSTPTTTSSSRWISTATAFSIS